jgi:hypothetical protein
LCKVATKQEVIQNPAAGIGVDANDRCGRYHEARSGSFAPSSISARIKFYRRFKSPVGSTRGRIYDMQA